MKKVMLNEFTGKEIRVLLNSGRAVTAIACFGSCENHADHLPLGPDYFVPEAMARRIAQQVDDTIVLPCTPFGTSVHYADFPMTISIGFETNIALVQDILNSLIKRNIKHIMLLNGHDGNIPVLEIAARNVKAQHPDVAIILIPAWWEIATRVLPDGFFASWQGSGLGHGGEGETSAMMAVRPDLVDLDAAVTDMPRDVYAFFGVDFICQIAEISRTGATGDPTLASRQKGEQMLDAVVSCLVAMLNTLNEKGWMYDYRAAAQSASA